MTDRSNERRATDPRRERRENTLQILKTWVEEHLDGDLSVAALAQQADMSPSRLSHWFRERTGVTPHAYVLAARIERAKALLHSSSLPLVDVALAVGFSSQSCLSVAFCRAVKMTPTQYRDRFSRKTKDTPPRRAPSCSRSASATAASAPRKRGVRA